MRNYAKIIIINIVLGLFSFGITAAFGAEEVAVLSAKNLQRLTSMIDNIKKSYYKPVSETTLFDKAIYGMLSGLDPHSGYLGPKELKDLELETSGKFGGIGVEVIPDNGAIKVLSPLDDTPAYRAGIKAGDYIVQINNKFVRDMTLRDAIGMMRGAKGSKVNLTIISKKESKPRVVSLLREIIKVEAVKDLLLEPGYGYVRLVAFQESTEEDMVEAINKLRKSSGGQLKGLLLDMRNNPGGLFESAVKVADDFLDARKLKNNSLIVYTKGQDEETQLEAKASDYEILPNVPIVVLINEGSASAAEIVAGALQDHNRAVIVGERSFGKGSVQVLLPIDKTSAMKLTTALYYTPLGNSIQAKGIVPNINVEEIQVARNDDKSLPRIDESSFIDHIDNGNGTIESKKLAEQQKQLKSESELMYKDFQLYEALHILKGLVATKPQE